MRADSLETEDNIAINPMRKKHHRLFLHNLSLKLDSCHDAKFGIVNDNSRFSVYQYAGQVCCRDRFGIMTTLALQWASYQIRKIAGCAGNAGNVFPRRRFQRKLLVSDPGMHHGTCVTHVPWCMSGSLTCGDGENVPGIPGACVPAILRIWQEAHALTYRPRIPSYIIYRPTID